MSIIMLSCGSSIYAHARYQRSVALPSHGSANGPSEPRYAVPYTSVSSDEYDALSDVPPGSANSSFGKAEF